MDSGCYQLKIKIKQNITQTIGALGLCSFKKGDYIYTGSAKIDCIQIVEQRDRR